MQHCPIPHSVAGSRVRRIEQGLNLLFVEMRNQPCIGPLERYRKDAADLFERCRFAMLEEAEE
jgi:hypothetical protein